MFKSTRNAGATDQTVAAEAAARQGKRHFSPAVFMSRTMKSSENALCTSDAALLLRVAARITPCSKDALDLANLVPSAALATAKTRTSMGKNGCVANEKPEAAERILHICVYMYICTYKISIFILGEVSIQIRIN